jgi:glycosyltransferase involved in cell wall biosynthesis
VPPDDVRGTARRLEQIIDDAELRERLGRGARQAMQRFDMELMVAGHLDVLSECAGRA